MGRAGILGLVTPDRLAFPRGCPLQCGGDASRCPLLVFTRHTGRDGCQIQEKFVSWGRLERTRSLVRSFGHGKTRDLWVSSPHGAAAGPGGSSGFAVLIKTKVPSKTESELVVARAWRSDGENDCLTGLGFLLG